MPARKPKPGESFGDLFPEIAKEWHPTKNGNLNPFDFSKGSDKKVWWKCHKGEDHEWIASIGNRSNGRGCPICAGKIVVKSNSLATTNPDLSKEWHPTKNGVLKPINVLQYSHKKVWWKCDKGDDHEWLASVSDRSNGNGCAVCHNRKVVKSNSLATTNPDLAKQWHPTKNGNLTPFNFVAGSGKKVWWKCDKGDEHEWIARISNRNNGRKCPICSGNKVIKSISLASTHPELVKEWHPVKNNGLLPTKFTKGSGKKVWWKCAKGDDHEWEEKIVNRTKNKHGCTICSGRKVVLSNCLATTHPNLAREWHSTKNGELTAHDFVAGSNKKVWWKCDKGDDHEWFTSCNERKNGRGCPFCAGKKVSKSNSFASIHPDLCKFWHPTKNGNLTPEDFSPLSNKKVWWKCQKGDNHEWQKSISVMVRLPNCNFCKSLEYLNPDFFKQWHPTKNKGINPKYISISSSKKVWWKCDKGDDHEWQSSVDKRSSGRGCPICSNYKIVNSNSLFTLDPLLSKEWHPTKNRNLTPKNIGLNHTKKVWWKCPKGEDHEWMASVIKRSSGRGCPVCKGLKVVSSNSLATLKPSLSKQWHPTKNGKLRPQNVTVHSNKQIWWKCDKGKDHEWKTSVNSRKVNGCPYCTLTPQSREELIITHELITIFKGINPRGFKTRVKGKLRSIDIYIPDLKLGIEFDGSYWHKDKRALDKLKTEELEAEGFNIIRVRQKPLKRIFEDDVMAEKKYDGKKITNDILIQIEKVFKLDSKTKAKILKYIKKPNLQNEKGLEKYIDMILTEKAEKK